MTERYTTCFFYTSRFLYPTSTSHYPIPSWFPPLPFPTPSPAPPYTPSMEMAWQLSHQVSIILSWINGCLTLAFIEWLILSGLVSRRTQTNVTSIQVVTWSGLIVALVLSAGTLIHICKKKCKITKFRIAVVLHCLSQKLEARTVASIKGGKWPSATGVEREKA